MKQGLNCLATDPNTVCGGNQAEAKLSISATQQCAAQHAENTGVASEKLSPAQRVLTHKWLCTNISHPTWLNLNDSDKKGRRNFQKKSVPSL